MNFSAIKTRSGFTLIELLVVVSIVAILASVASINALASNQKSRDAKRQADLRTLQTAIELYKQKNGQYPVGCTPANAASAQGWSGQLGTNYACAGNSTQYIVGLAPEFIPVLPMDKKLNGANSGYVYTTNAAGTVYKIMAMNTVEAERLNTEAAYTHPFRSCDIRATQDAYGGFTVDTTSWCVTTAHNGVPAQCQYTNARFQSSYGLWGGIAQCTGTCLITAGAGANTSKAWTQDVICK